MFGIAEASKICKRCEQTKPETDFHRRGAGKGRKPICSKCRSETRRGRQESPAQRHARLLWEQYKLTPEQYMALFDSQGGVCAICEEMPKAGARLFVDHCHATGVVRALLCNLCNLMIGVFENNHRLATEYLAAYGAGNPLLKQ